MTLRNGQYKYLMQNPTIPQPIWHQEGSIMDYNSTTEATTKNTEPDLTTFSTTKNFAYNGTDSTALNSL